MQLTYPDTATFVKVSSAGYSTNKVVVSQEEIPVVFIQNTGFERTASQDGIISDAICYPDPENQFVCDNHKRLEGMYVLAPLFGADEDEGWFKVIKVLVNRDHLLGNQIDNIQVLLKKSSKINGVS